MLLDDLKELYCACFDDGNDFVNYFFERYYLGENAVYNHVDGKIVSAVYLINKTARIRKCEFAFPFLSAVSTLPQYRNRGFAAGCINSALLKLYNEEVGFAALYPVFRSFYFRFGFATVNEVTVDTVHYTPLEVKFLPPTPLVLAQIYHDACSKFNDKLLRTAGDFDLLLGDWAASGNNIVVLNCGAKKCYCTYDSHNVEEAVGDTDLLSAIPDLDGKTYLTPSGNEDYIMSRIVNVKTVLEGISYSKDGEVCFNLTDSFLPFNSGSYHLKVLNGKGKLAKLKNNDAKALSLTIEQLTKWIFGKYDVFDLLDPIEFVCYDKY